MKYQHCSAKKVALHPASRFLVLPLLLALAPASDAIPGGAPARRAASVQARQLGRAGGGNALLNEPLNGETSAMDEPDGGSDEGNELIITSTAKTQRECAAGYVIEVYDDTGTVHTSTPGVPLSVAVPSAWHGWAGVMARCGRRFWKDWSNIKGMTAQKAGIASITLDGIELATHDTLVCDDAWGPGMKPMVPLDTPNRGKCP